MLDGTRMRTYDYDVLLHEDEEIQHSHHDDSMTSDWGRFKGPASAWERSFGSAGESKAVVAVQSRS